MAFENPGDVAVLATIHWEGDSRKVLSTFPKAVRQKIGVALYALQQGESPTIATRRMESIGAGVFELKTSDEWHWYRAIYLSRIDDVIHVLYCFEKQSRKTDARDLRLARTRLTQLRSRIEGARHAKKTKSK
jgi:phage-related protein